MNLPKPTQGEPHYDGGMTNTQFWVLHIPLIATFLMLLWLIF